MPRFLLKAMAVLVLSAGATRIGSSACLTTLPPNPPFVPPPPYDEKPLHGSSFWYGTKELWTRLGTSGTWRGLKPYSSETGGLRQKVFWWSDGYNWVQNSKPDLIVTGRRLDGDAPAFANAKATNAYADDIGSAMLTGLDVPTHGCWEITAHYKGRTLTLVVLLEP